MKAIRKESNIEEELKIVKERYKGDYNHDLLVSELDMLPVIFNESKPVNFEDLVIKSSKALSKEKRKLMPKIITILRLVLTCGATTATPEQSISLLRRTKTWQRSTMTQKRLNSLSILQEHSDIVDKMSLIDVANEFVAQQPYRLNTFGKFTNEDL